MAVATQALAIVQGITAARQMKQLQNSVPSGYSVSAPKKDVYERALQNVETGYLPGEKTSFYRNNARSLNSLLRQGRASGGGQSSNALLTLGLDAKLNAEQKFAESEAQLRRNSLAFLDQASNVYQNVSEANKQRELNQYDQAVLAASGLANTAIENSVNSINQSEAMAAQMLSGGAMKAPATDVSAGVGGAAPQTPIVTNDTPAQIAPPAPYNTRAVIQGQQSLDQRAAQPTRWEDMDENNYPGNKYYGRSRPIRR